MTPLMQQYWEIKSQFQEPILLFRMGDFYEMFHQDAEKAAPILGIALTVRNRKASDETKMCGVPHHSIAGPISKLLAAGLKVAICDQIEDPALAKGIVKRAVTRVLSPGMVYDPATLDQLSANYLAAWDESALAFLEPSTGEAFYYSEIESTERLRLLELLRPVEVILVKDRQSPMDTAGLSFSPHLSWVEDRAGQTAVPDPTLATIPGCARRLREYALGLQGLSLSSTLRPFVRRSASSGLKLGPTVLRHLEFFTNMRGEKSGTFFQAVDRTRTAAGARLLKSWLSFPLTDASEIQRRQQQVAFWVSSPQPLKQVREIFSEMGDIERRLGKLSTPNCNARDLLALAQSLRAGLAIAAVNEKGRRQLEYEQIAADLVAKIERELLPEPPIQIRQGGMFQRGVSAQLDELVDLSENSQRILLELEARERRDTGIGSLKVRYNNVFGFYFEVTKTHSEKVPAHYRRKQTLVNAERFTTDELTELESKVLSAQSRRAEVEYQLFVDLRERFLKRAAELLTLAHEWSELDVFCALAWLAIERGYTRPEFIGDGAIEFEALRHPVVEQQLGVGFVANSFTLKPGHCLLLTGPNMAGKSTLMRQVALAVVLAQVGSFVPAARLRMPILNSIFTRIGASDHLAEGLSTFMVEMRETAELMRLAGPNSLVILDEIGRGTSTYDGLSLAQAILEHLLTHGRPFLLFATHYHELTALSSRWPQIHNAHMAIQERGSEISFLHALKQGPANKSYGVHVAKLAGLPPAVLERARQILSEFEQSPAEQLSLALSLPAEVEDLLAQLRATPIAKMTPLDALNQIAKWQQSLS